MPTEQKKSPVTFQKSSIRLLSKTQFAYSPNYQNQNPTQANTLIEMTFHKNQTDMICLERINSLSTSTKAEKYSVNFSSYF